MAAPRWVYPFDSGAKSRDLLGGKGSGLANMYTLDLPVPPGFTIATPAWALQHELGGEIPDDLRAEIDAALSTLECESYR